MLVWGTTWHAILYQIGAAPAGLGVGLRFTLAGLLLLALAAWRGDRLRFRGRAQAMLVLQGVFMYSLSYLCVYHAEHHVPSGLVAVGYSASPLLNGIAAARLWGAPLGRRFVAGGLLGLLGVVLIFWPEFATLGGSDTVWLGAGFTAGAVALSSVGSLAAARNADNGLPFWPALGWGMLYGGLLTLAISAATETWPAARPTAPSWWLSLLYLALAGSVVAFACYLKLQQRLGPGKASAVGVMTPLLALVVSAAFEGYRPGPVALAGVVLAVLGNVLMLRGRSPR